MSSSHYAYVSQRFAHSPSLMQRVFEGICEEIATGQIQPGEFLSRRKVAQRYGVSYTPVIEAFIRLEQTGLLEANADQMAQVCPLTLEKIQNDFMIREALETQAIRVACDKATPDQIEELYRLAEAVDERASAPRQSTIEEGPSLHWEFHRQIGKLSQSAALVRELERLALLCHFRSLWLGDEQYVAPDPPRSHGRLVDVIRDRELAAADAEIRAHIRRGLQNECHAFQLRQRETKNTESFIAVR